MRGLFKAAGIMLLLAGLFFGGCALMIAVNGGFYGEGRPGTGFTIALILIGLGAALIWAARSEW